MAMPPMSAGALKYCTVLGAHLTQDPIGIAQPWLPTCAEALMDWLHAPDVCAADAVLAAQADRLVTPEAIGLLLIAELRAESETSPAHREAARYLNDRRHQLEAVLASRHSSTGSADADVVE